MNRRDIFESKTKDEWIGVAKEAKTNYENLVQIFRYDGACSNKLALKICKAGDFSLSVLKPELAELITAA